MSSDGSDECVCPEGTVEDANGNCVTPTTPLLLLRKRKKKKKALVVVVAAEVVAVGFLHLCLTKSQPFVAVHAQKHP